MAPTRSEVAAVAASNRPPIVSHHSSSVPSTPRQHARERSTRSRSPSLRRGMGRHSPKSVYSESSGMDAQRRGCEFEPAQTFGRRRFEWTTGSDEPLPFEASNAFGGLDIGVEQELARDANQLYDRLAATGDSVERRQIFVRKLEGLLKETWPKQSFKVHVYGSSGNMLCTSDSDVDICIETPDKYFEKVCHLARMFAQNGMQRVICMNFIRAVPIVKIWDPELKLACDMNVNQKLAIWNTKMIKAYVGLDARVKQLALIVKYWTRRRKIHEAGPPGTLSSYTWTCMIINFLQTRQPPILPPLADNESEEAISRDHWGSAIHRLETFEGYKSRNKESLAELLFGFFFHYGYGVDYRSEVISVRLGRLFPKAQKPEFREPLCVEEPFTPRKNLSASADPYAVNGIHKELRRAFELVKDGKLAECCEPYLYPEISVEPRRRLDSDSIFEKPRITPRPLLRRSSSQHSGRSHRAGNTVRGGRGGQNSRGGHSGRRSSAVVNGLRQQLTPSLSPPLRALTADQLESSQNALHDQLYQQYNYLRNRQALLQAQLTQSQNTQADRSTQPYPYVNPFGIVYHYPAHYAPLRATTRPMFQQGATTNPPSPSLSTVDPLLRRGFARASDNNGGYGGSIRSQSQPARAVPTNTATHSVLQGKLDPPPMEGQHILGPVQPPAVSNLFYGSVPMVPSASQELPLATSLREDTLRKPYLGYYLANRPYIVGGTHPGMSQYRNLQLPQIPTYGDLAHRRSLVSPDTAHTTDLNGQDDRSRTPSPLNHVRSFSTGLQTTLLPHQAPIDITGHTRPPGPIIVNGSRTSPPLELTQRNLSQHDRIGTKTSKVRSAAIHPSMFDSLDYQTQEVSSAELKSTTVDIMRWQDQAESLASNFLEPVTNGDVTSTGLPGRSSTGSPAGHSDVEAHLNGEVGTSMIEAQQNFHPSDSKSDSAHPHRMQLSVSAKISTDKTRNETHPGAPRHSLASLPMLSPVAETRTPSPGLRSFDVSKSHHTNGYPTSMLPPPPTPVTSEGKENHIHNHVRSNSAITNKTEVNGTANGVAPNAWQQAGKKNKRSKANINQRSVSGIKGQGEVMPAFESERKGG